MTKEEYVELFKKYERSCEPLDLVKAKEAIDAFYVYNNVPVPKNLIEVESPYQGARIAAAFVKIGKLYGDRTYDSTLIQVKGDEVFYNSKLIKVNKNNISEQASMCHYGQFEAYWVCHYKFNYDQIEKVNDALTEINVNLVKECGPFWYFSDYTIVSRRPLKLNIITENDKQYLHDENDMALKYLDGRGINAFKGKIAQDALELATLRILGDK